MRTYFTGIYLRSCRVLVEIPEVNGLSSEKCRDEAVRCSQTLFNLLTLYVEKTGMLAPCVEIDSKMVKETLPDIPIEGAV